MSVENYIDIGVVVVLLVFGIRGMQNGLIAEIMGVVGVVLGVFLASKYYILGAEYIEKAGLTFENSSILWILSFVLILSLVWILCVIIGSVVQRFLIAMPSLAIVNYFGGYLFCALKYFLIFSILVYGLSQVEFLKKPIKEHVANTKSYPIMIEVAQKIISADAIKSMTEELKDNAKKVDKEINKQKEKIIKDLLK